MTELEMIRAEVRKTGMVNVVKAKEYGEKFWTGRLRISDGLKELGYSDESDDLNEIFAKYCNGDWGDTDPDDAKINDNTVETGYGDIMGKYYLNGKTIYIKTTMAEYVETWMFLREEFSIMY